MHRPTRLADTPVAAVRLLRPGGTTHASEGGGSRRASARFRMAVVLLGIVATVLGLAPSASAAYAIEPVGPAWTPNSGVHSVVTDGTRVYVGGTFTGGVAALDASTGRLIWQGSADGDVRALALGPNGSLLLGGAFNTVGGTTHRKIASVNAATGSVNETFKGAAGGTIRDIVVIGNTAYFGGSFINHGGMAQQNLGAVDATTGANVTTFTPSTNAIVYSLGTDGARLFIGGAFTAVNGQPRNYLASVTLSSNTLDPWTPPLACSTCNRIWDLRVDAARGRVYTAGRNAGGLYILNMHSNTPIYRLGGFNGDTQALTLAPDGRLFVGGHFVTVGGVPRELVAEFDVSGPNGTKPVLKEFSTNFVTSFPGVWAMASTPSRLYVGGDFTVAGNQVNGKKYPYFAMFPAVGADATAPTVTGTGPAANATGVAATTDVTATFSEPVTGVSGTTFTLTGPAGSVAAAVGLDAAGTTATLNPSADLTAGATYTATLTGGTGAIRDLANNPLATTSWSFTVAAPAGDTVAPTVTGTSPAAGATGVAATTAVTATFSEPVTGVSGTTFTLTGPSGAVAAAVGLDAAGTTATLDPSADLAANTTYTATLTSGIEDAAGNSFAGATWSFTTAESSVDDTAPTVTAHHPRDGATAISRSVSPNALFSEQVQNVTTTTFTLVRTDTGAPVAGKVLFNSTSGRWVFNPDPTLDALTTYTATVHTGITDLAGNPLAAPVTWRFTTGA